MRTLCLGAFCPAISPSTPRQPQNVCPPSNDHIDSAFGWDSCRHGAWYKHLLQKIDLFKARARGGGGGQGGERRHAARILKSPPRNTHPNKQRQEAGCTHLWLPPPSQSVSQEGYLPGQLYNLCSAYGSEAELVALNAALRAAGIAPVADIVINHRCADVMEDGVWNKFSDDVDHHGRKLDWGKWAITGDDPEFGGSGNPDTGDDYGPAPDLVRVCVCLIQLICASRVTHTTAPPQHTKKQTKQKRTTSTPSCAPR